MIKNGLQQFIFVISVLSQLERIAGSLVCPGGTIQVGGVNEDIAGCGLELCDDRYNKHTIGQCAIHCLQNVECDSFTWELAANTNVCTIYNGAIPNQKWTNQVMCKPHPSKSYYLTERRHGISIVAGDNADNNIYHQYPNGRTNAKWVFTEAGDGYFYICDEKHGLCIVAGDNYDNNVYHQPHHYRDNAKWRLHAMEWGCTGATLLNPGCNYELFDKKHGRALVSGNNPDNEIYHQYPDWRYNARWAFTATVDIIESPQFTNMRGYWRMIGSVGGAGKIQQAMTTGITSTVGTSITDTFTQSLSISVSAGFEFKGVSASTTVTSTIAHSTANTLSESLAQKTEEQITVTCDSGVQYLHQFMFECDAAIVRTHRYRCTNAQYPQCGPGFFNCAPGDPNCNTCTSSWTSQ